jgi:hypothetical protein
MRRQDAPQAGSCAPAPEPILVRRHLMVVPLAEAAARTGLVDSPQQLAYALGHQDPTDVPDQVDMALFAGDVGLDVTVAGFRVLRRSAA